MILISHRGNINGRLESLENEPAYIDLAIKKDYLVEVDVWYVNNVLYLGHDKPLYGVDFGWFRDRLTKIWVHCKNIEAFEFFKKQEYKFNYFWHENEKSVITSENYIISHVDEEPTHGTIAMMPEKHNFDVSKCLGVCSDYIEKYKNI